MIFASVTSTVVSLLKTDGSSLVLIASSGLLAGLTFAVIDSVALASFVWALATLPILSALLLQTFRSLRRGDLGLDIVAALSMAFALSYGESLAANVVTLMYAGGQMLEGYASGRAAREMTMLMGRMARTAFRYVGDRLELTPIEKIVAGDHIMIRQGEVLPVDGILLSARAILDESALTGEPLPVGRRAGEEVLSGSASIGPVFTVKALRPASESTYAAVVRLVETAQKSKAPMARLADRYGLVFLLMTVVIASTAWLLSDDPRRALAVLVIATPCPLILAVPVALMSGISRCASIGCLVKDGSALEALSRVRVAILDKTGTLTHGKAQVVAVGCGDWVDKDELLRLAASLDQASSHVMAAALIAAAHERNLLLSPPTNVEEVGGTGLEGMVDGRRVVIGGSRFVKSRSAPGASHAFEDHHRSGEAAVTVAIDGVVAGNIIMADPVRAEAISVLQRLRSAGIAKIVLASGDRLDVASHVGNILGIEQVLGEQTPASKVEAVIAAKSFGPVMMVGDGVNDAPALAAADVGVALGARGAAASSEAAGVVLLVDRLDPLASALVVARRTVAIARQSVVAGLGLSVAGMIAAAFGYLPPLHGALLQEVIDVAVILNALRALGPSKSEDDPYKQFANIATRPASKAQLS
ncbi:heavy metal translocating P-type ATPase [Agrobacterium sp. ICMP 7243]|uniref:heavy metal translocating P-type ATPase n=1 Tax=Rhizobium rhizogenes TaxID=359 RepID=UPI00123C1CFE|nr:heavy metal translocating P-type ATPase [Rhizobium rhizogenes]KAA6486486.1 heavy metal translocating P-type ATPase [Agrobacterium sp. ICMP 7243]NTF50796.1 heavy metal translocating P-type ATPase [Rhizobium rhizogenes]NTH08174.1 heavy metal translocating P-type ATPase [Rhizobium rhizogenes]